MRLSVQHESRCWLRLALPSITSTLCRMRIALRVCATREPVIAPECRCFGLSNPADPLLLSRFFRLAFRSRFDESSYSLRLRHVDGVASLNLDNSCACTFRDSPLRQAESWRSMLVPPWDQLHRESHLPPGFESDLL